MEPNAKVPHWGILELQGPPTNAQTLRTTAAPPDPARFPFQDPLEEASLASLTPRGPRRRRALGGDSPPLGFAAPSPTLPASALA